MLVALLSVAVPSAARANELPLVGQAQQQLTQATQDTASALPQQVTDALPTAARRAVAEPPVGELARRAPGSVQATVDEAAATATTTLSHVDAGALGETAAQVAAVAPASVEGAVRRPDTLSASASPSPSPSPFRPQLAERPAPSTADRSARIAGASIVRSAGRIVLSDRHDLLAADREPFAAATPQPALPAASAADDAARPSTGASGGERPAPSPLGGMGGGTSAAATGGGSIFFSTALAVLVAALGFGALGAGRRLLPAGVRWCPSHVAGVLERPG